MQAFFDAIPDMILRPFVAVICAAVLGFDREIHGKPAGLRTQMMVALGTTVFTMTTWQLHERMAMENPAQAIDPTRVIAGVIGGLGFLGAGSIVRAGASVRGLTTASTVWVIGAIGIACGLGNFALAGTTTGFAALILMGIGFLEHRRKFLPESWVSQQAQNDSRANGGDDS